MYFQVVQPSSRHIGQLLLSPSGAELGAPDKRQMASGEVLSYCPSVVLSVAVRKELRMKNKDTGNTRAGFHSGSSLQGQVFTKSL